MPSTPKARTSTQLPRTTVRAPHTHGWSRWGTWSLRDFIDPNHLGETHGTLLVNGNGHMLVLVSINSDDHLNGCDHPAADCCSHFCLLQGVARRPDERTRLRRDLMSGSYQVTAPMAFGAKSAISASSRQINRKASGPVSNRVRPEPGWHGNIIAVSNLSARVSQYISAAYNSS